MKLDTSGLAGSRYSTLGDRKDLAMRNQRSFSLEFRRQVAEELLSDESQSARLCQRYNISSSVLYHLKKQYRWKSYKSKLEVKEQINKQR